MRRWSPAWASLPYWALPKAFRTHSTAAAFRTNRYLAVTASFIIRVMLAEVARDHAVRAFAVWTANPACGPVALAAYVFGIGFLVAEGAGYRTVWTCPAHLVLVAAWLMADGASEPSFVLAMRAVLLPKHGHEPPNPAISKCMRVDWEVDSAWEILASAPKFTPVSIRASRWRVMAGSRRAPLDTRAGFRR